MTTGGVKEIGMRLSPYEQSLLGDNLSDVVWIWALRLMDSGAVQRPPATAGPTDEQTRAAGQLARLAAIEEMRRRLDEMAAHAAEEAALYGAGYPQLGEAVGIGRHAARRRWPAARRIMKGWRRRPRRDLDEAISRFKTEITDGWY
jgi:hypothetical protein